MCSIALRLATGHQKSFTAALHVMIELEGIILVPVGYY